MSLIQTSTANYAGFGNLTAKTAQVGIIDVEEVNVDAITAGAISCTSLASSGAVSGATVTASGAVTGASLSVTGNVTCNTLNYTTLNPAPPAFSTVSTLATLVTQTIPDGNLVWCADKAALFRGLQNPADTTILPTGTPWGADGYLTMILEISQVGTNAPFVIAKVNELFVGTTVNIVPTGTRSSPGNYSLNFPSVLPYAAIVESVVFDLTSSQSVAQVGADYYRSGGPPYSLIQIQARDYAGNSIDLSNTSPGRLTLTLKFVPRANF